MCLPGQSPSHCSPPNASSMDYSSLSAHATNRRRTRCNGPARPIKSYDLNESQVQERANMSQGYRSNTSKENCVPGELFADHRVLHPRHLRATSEGSAYGTCSQDIFPSTKPLQKLKSVDQVSPPLRLTKRNTVLDGPPVKQGEEMELSRRSEYEPAGIPDQQETTPPAAISTPSPKENEAPAGSSEAPLEDTPPRKQTFKSLSKDDEIQFYTLPQRIHRLREILRGILRSKQYVKAIADDKADQEGQLQSSDGETLQDLFQDYDCNALEDQLGSREYELTRLEENFVRICNLAFPHQSEGSDSDAPQTFHPLVAEYLSKLGDEKQVLEANRETLQRINVPMRLENEAWLQQADELEGEILRDLRKAQMEAEELKKRCLAAGLLDENGEPKDFQTQEHEAFSAEEDVDADGQMSEYVRFPTLLPQPGTKDMKFKASAPKPGEQSGSAGDHINQWLLHSLRTSPLDVGLLARTFEAVVGDIESQKWELDDASGYRIDSVESESTPVYGRSRLWEDAIQENKIEPVQGIIGRKPAVSNASSVSGSDMYGIDGQNERVVDPLPRSKYLGEGI
ncbi:hypothetical protein N431DRAFT_548268 [Stipitochalara longipes BDJ]|nr:hypothetical protein N431DRAFT_548268 [Stipitochalara longipes BDJ]